MAVAIFIAGLILVAIPITVFVKFAFLLMDIPINWTQALGITVMILIFTTALNSRRR